MPDQTLIKLERWVDAVEFCDRALHIDGECVKALSRRASAFVNLAGELAPPEGHASPSAGIPLVPGPSCGDGTIFSVVIDGTRVSNKAGSAELNGHIYESTRPPTPQKRGDWGDDGIEEYMFHDLSGGREGLMALALADLNKAVDVDREGVEDLQRQRQTLTRKIKEELVRLLKSPTKALARSDLDIIAPHFCVISVILGEHQQMIERTNAYGHSYLVCPYSPHVNLRVAYVTHVLQCF